MRNTTCQRCLTGNEVRYRAYTDIMEIDICNRCAQEARRLGISLASIAIGDERFAPSVDAGNVALNAVNVVVADPFLGSDDLADPVRISNA